MRNTKKNMELPANEVTQVRNIFSGGDTRADARKIFSGGGQDRCIMSGSGEAKMQDFKTKDYQ